MPPHLPGFGAARLRTASLLASVAVALSGTGLALPDVGVAQAPVDLLRATRAEVAVSSAYRNRTSQAASLVDGDLESAWNSRTGDLEGAWIAFRVPAAATVDRVALTVGFTRVRGDRDLFTGNHRVTRVRLTHGGTAVGEFDLDPEVRGLQEIPVGRGGGVYRLEVLALEPGSRSDWREVCVSELQVLGRAPGQAPGTRVPRVAIGELPAPAAAPTPARSRAALPESLDRFGREWRALVSAQGERRRLCDLDDQDHRDTATYRRRRSRYLRGVADLVEPLDGAQAAALRTAADARGTSDWTFLTNADHALVVGALQRAVEAAGDAALSCRWADANAGLHLRRVADAVLGANHACEHLDMDYPEGPPRDELRSCRTLERALERYEAWGRASGSLRRHAARLTRYDPPAPLLRAVPQLDVRWRAMRDALSAAAQRCGWPASATSAD